MANVGLTNLWWANLTEGIDGTPTYDGAKTLGKAVSCSVSITNNDAKLYGDDALAESDTSFASGSVTLGVTDDNDEIFAPLLGHDIDASGEIVRTSTDAAPYVGLGRIVTKMVNGAYKYKVEFLYKVKFSEPSRDENTKGENLEFSTPSIEGVVASLADVNGTWSKSKTFDSKADALEYLKDLLAAPTVTYTVTFDVNGGSGTVAPQTVPAGQAINLPTTGVTPPEGKTFSGWGTTSGATTTVASPYTPVADVTLYAVYEAI